ncbi:hypothetical protein [Pseudomonas viridiflava]|uniref:hypothetical protein n=1 Tax=Pseudomonas viridiflava TaxID=33069 RepID=UPI0021807373|nr:hypothetical protein [Pseudomonas viridiflava]
MNPTQSAKLMLDAGCWIPVFFRSPSTMMRLNAQVEKVYLYPKTVDFRKSIDGMAALVEPDIRIAVFDPVLSFSSTSDNNAIPPTKTRALMFFSNHKRLTARPKPPINTYNP